jgi:hypothetical protein
MAKYNIAGREFRSQAAILAHVSEIKDRYADRVDLSPGDLGFMVALLGRHPHAERKIGCGVRRMWVQANPVGQGRGFVLERLDGQVQPQEVRAAHVPRAGGLRGVPAGG